MSLSSQLDQNFEIIIADDGSDNETHRFITQFTQHSHLSIKHARHDDQGFRAGTIRNKAAALSQGEYLIFIDGDCVVLPNFIKRHRQLAAPGYFVPGNRILLTREFTTQALQEPIQLHNKPFRYFLSLWLKGHINRILPLIYNPFPLLRYLHPKRWQKAMTCNLALYKKDFISVNGFDEAFEGWGFEDSDLVIRLIHNGIKRKEGRFAVPVLHHWHPQNDQSRHQENYQRLMKRLQEKNLIRAGKGIKQYLT